MKAPCLVHDWVYILPGQRKVTYQGKEWWPMSGFDTPTICSKCGKLHGGVLLFPAGWEGDPVIIGCDAECS